MVDRVRGGIKRSIVGSESDKLPSHSYQLSNPERMRSFQDWGETGEVLGESKFYAAQSSTYSCIGFSSALDNLGMHNCYWQGRRTNNYHQTLAGFRPNTSEHHLPPETLTPDSPSTTLYYRHDTDPINPLFIPMTHQKNHTQAKDNGSCCGKHRIPWAVFSRRGHERWPVILRWQKLVSSRSGTGRSRMVEWFGHNVLRWTRIDSWYQGKYEGGLDSFQRCGWATKARTSTPSPDLTHGLQRNFRPDRDGNWRQRTNSESESQCQSIHGQIWRTQCGYLQNIHDPSIVW